MTRSMHIDDLYNLATPMAPVLSPDGGRIAYVLRTADREGDRNLHQVWMVAGEGPARRLTGGQADTAPAWSPDGRRLAFSRAEEGPAQVWLLPADGGEPVQLTQLAQLPLGAGAPVWSPDGQRIAFAALVDNARDDDHHPGAEADNAPMVSDRLGYRADGSGLIGTMRRHLHVVDVESGATRRITSGDWHVGAFAWAPDSARLAFAADTAPDQDLALRAPIHLVDATTSLATSHVVALREGIAASITWAPEGDAVVVVGTVGPPAGHLHLLHVPLDGGEPVDLAASLDRNVMAGAPGYPGATPMVTDDGATVLFCARDRGCTQLYAVPLDGGQPRLVLGAEGEVVSGLSVANGTAAVALTTEHSFGEVVTVDLASNATATRTDHGADLAELSLFPRVAREFAISDGTTVQGWLMSDPQQSGPRPLLLDIHGGPHNAWNAAADSVHVYHQELVSRGWAVLLVNPRGSDGYGQHFYSGVDGRWGEVDAKDFLEPLDVLVAERLADPKRLAVAGYSYGGFMTCYLTSRDDRFAAAVTGGVVSELASLVGTCDDGALLAQVELGAQPWDDPELYARLSPFTMVQNVQTPTLVVHGAQDTTCPVGQAQQWHHALRTRGVPTRLVLYPGASHLFILDGPPSQRVDYNRRLRDWLQQYAADAPGRGRPAVDSVDWRLRLAQACDRHGVVGAQLGILRLGADGGGAHDELVTAASGLLNQATGAKATTDSLFQIGSITKVWTATLAMQLVDEDLIALDTPLVEVLPELRLADPDVTKQVTLKHLLTHTSGIDGDLFTDTGRGDDCLEKFVDLLRDAAQNHPLGATWSYCNSGFTLVGRVIEVLTGTSWDAAIRKRLFEPLGLHHTVTLPEESLLHTAAVGHVGEGNGPLSPTKVWGLPRSTGPAGLISSTAQDVLAFARMHLSGGVNQAGEQVLSRESVAAMADRHAELPDKHTLGDSWGLGWIRYDWDGHRLIGHDGATLGQGAVLRMLPEQGLAVTLLTNGGDVRALTQDIVGQVFSELAGVLMPEPLGPPAEPLEVDISSHVGTYERASIRTEVRVENGAPVMRTTVTGPLAELLAEVEQEYEVVPLEPDLFVVRTAGSKMWTPLTFYRLPSGDRYLHFGGRATRQVSST